MKSREHVSALSAPVLADTVRHQRRPRHHLRYEPTVIYLLAEQARAAGVDLESVPGPWQVGQRRLTRPGRRSLDVIPLVTNERAEVMVDTMEHAADVAGLLNWCGVYELHPIADLTPPAADESAAQPQL